VDRATVLYDGACGLCRWAAERIRRWDRVGRLRLVALQAVEADELLRGLSDEARFSSWHLVDDRGRLTSAGSAVPPLLRLLPGGRPLAVVAARFPRLTDRAYRWVADHRDRLGRLLGPTACAVDPSRRAPDRS
jgi:predicted DCC family thiol-disulfide oxidoreductase YuxK